MRKVLTVATVLVVTLALLLPGYASGVDYWFTRLGETTPIGNGGIIELAQGQQLDFSVWYYYDPAYEYKPFLTSVFIGFGVTATGYGEAAGPLSTPKVYPVNAPPYDDSLRSLWPTSGFASQVTNKPRPMLGGGLHPDDPAGSAERPWGLWQSVWWDPYEDPENLGVGTKKLFNVKLDNHLLPGEQATLEIWDPRIYGSIDYTRDDFNTMTLGAKMSGGSEVYALYTPGYTYSVTVTVPGETVIPEPSGLLALATGAAGMVGLILRRRK